MELAWKKPEKASGGRMEVGRWEERSRKEGESEGKGKERITREGTREI